MGGLLILDMGDVKVYRHTGQTARKGSSTGFFVNIDFNYSICIGCI